MADLAPTAHDLPSWRGRILRALLISTCWFGLVAYVPSLWLSLQSGMRAIAIIDTLVYASVLVVTFAPSLPYRVRAMSMPVIAYLLGIALVVNVGTGGNGLYWMAVAPVFAAIVLGLRAAIVFLVINAATMVALGIAIGVGWFAYAPVGLAADAGLALFIVGCANTFLLSTAVAWSIGALLRGLEESQARLRLEIDDRVRAMADRERLEQQLRESQKLEAVGRLASGIAHDFNNLLVPVLGNAEELQRRFAPGSREAAALADIVVSAERGRSLVDRVLTFSRRSAAPRTPIRIASVVKDAAQLLRAGLPRSVGIDIEIDDPDLVVLAGTTDIHQVVMNLGTNAGHAMRAMGGTLTLALAADEGGASVTLRVSDTGTGMTPEVRDRAFEPFFTTKPAGEGSGLGLATVHAIVSGLDGRVAIDTTPGRGTTVRVTLPRHMGTVDDDQGGRSDASVDQPRATRAARILVVDDEPLVLKLCARVLSKSGFDVTTLGDAREAATFVVAHADAFDVLVTDKTMPGFSGLELASIARTANPTLPVVLATGFLDDAARAEAAEVGITIVIAKPYRAADLVAAVNASLATADGVRS